AAGHRGGDRRPPHPGLLRRSGGGAGVRRGDLRRPAAVRRAAARRAAADRRRRQPRGAGRGRCRVMAAARQPGIRLADLVTEVAVPGPGAGLRVSGLALDSRAVRPGDLFFALRGQRHDGREFLAAAAAAGAVAALIDAAAPAPTAPLPVFAVADLAERISAIAGRFYGEPSHALVVTGIT